MLFLVRLFQLFHLAMTTTTMTNLMFEKTTRFSSKILCITLDVSFRKKAIVSKP